MSLLERTLSEIAQPRWEGAPGFEQGWQAIVQGAQELKWPRETREWHCSVLPRLADSRVLTIAPDQLDALPKAIESISAGWVQQGSGSDLQKALNLVTLPFDPVFIDGGGARAVVVADGMADLERFRLVGAIVGSDYVTPFIEDVATSLILSPGDFARAPREGKARVYIPLGSDHGDRPAMTMAIRFAVERITAVLQWLESINVEVVDQVVSRQVRRAAERRGAEIAKVVRVKLPRSWRNGQPPPSRGTRNWSHRWEVAGHYMYFPESTRLAQAAPDKLSWVPEREAYFRRVWCPPHVKGPADKPLIPKTRKLVGAET